MENFRFENQTRILFGRDTQCQIGAYSAQYADRVLILYGSKRAKDNGLLAEIESSLRKQDIAYFELGGIEPNPRLSKVNDGIGLCIKEHINFIIAVGGGSVIDTAKAIAMADNESQDIWDYFSHKKVFKGTNIKIGVVLTIAASGSESSGSTVITNDLVGPNEKRDMTSNALRPVFAILNPELTVSLPWDQTAWGGIDILAHVMERYFTRVQNVELSDRMCEAVMITVINNLRKLKNNLEDYNARAEIMWAGTIAHNNILSAGRRSDWASHMIEHELSALYDIPHGKGLAMIIPAWMHYVSKDHAAIFAQYAVRVWDIPENGMTLKQLADEGIEKTIAFYEELGQEASITSLGVTDRQIQYIARSATKYGSIGDLKKLNEDDIVNILKLKVL